MRFSILRPSLEAMTLPAGPVRLDACTVVNDPALMIRTHCDILAANPGKTVFRPYYDRLLLLYKTLKANEEGGIQAGA